ncbi:hypothetical protein BSA145_21355 (plasmid) [Bacillus safensis]|uniref:Uncharacterized protein n=1 Tax=Bacillus safensis TaxID=561879 RepID=A0A1L6ZPI6_BACIA|nr:hypothetical protein BSA145_21355 [Bacillus safensis]
MTASRTLFFATAAGLLFVGNALAQLSKLGEPGCEQCRPGEYRMRIEDTIPPGPDYARSDAPPCGDGTAITEAVASAVSAAIQTYAGVPNPKAIAGSIGKVTNALQIRGAVGDILGSAGQQYSACKAVCIIVPQSANVTGVHFEITKLENNKPGEMEVVDPTKPHFDYGRVDFPIKKPGVVCTTVANWAYRIDRRFIMDAYFTSTEQPLEIR